MLKNIFDMENPVMRAMGIAADLLILNALTVLCCLPVLTAGAAYTALNDVALRIVRGDDPYLVRTYFRSFRKNLKQGSALGIIFLLAAAILITDDRVAAASAPVLRVFTIAAAIVILAVALYAFALLARYENTLWGTVKNAVALSVGFFPRTVGMLTFIIGFWFLSVRFVQYVMPLFLMFGFSLPCYVCALLYDHIFQVMER